MRYKHLAIVLLFILWIINGYFVFTTKYAEHEIPLEGVTFIFLSFGVIAIVVNFFHDNWDKPIRSTKL